jgi:hypothetical protein
MRTVKLLFLPLLLALGAAPAAASVLITVDKGAQRMLVSVDGKQLHSWPVSTGRAAYETPSGTFRPFRLEEEHYSKEWDDAPMPHSIFFTPSGHAIHGSLETRRLGRRASHGCIRLSPANASALFALVRAEGLGATKVVVTEGTTVQAARKPRKVRPEEDDYVSETVAPRPMRVPSRAYGPAERYDEIFDYSQ